MNSFGSFRQYDYLDYGLESIDSKEDNCEGLKVIVVEPDENAEQDYGSVFYDNYSSTVLFEYSYRY